MIFLTIVLIIGGVAAIKKSLDIWDKKTAELVGSLGFTMIVIGAIFGWYQFAVGGAEEEARQSAENMGYYVIEVCTERIAYRTDAQKVIVQKEGNFDQIWFQDGQQLHNYKRGENGCQ